MNNTPGLKRSKSGDNLCSQGEIFLNNDSKKKYNITNATKNINNINTNDIKIHTIDAIISFGRCIIGSDSDGDSESDSDSGSGSDYDVDVIDCSELSNGLFPDDDDLPYLNNGLLFNDNDSPFNCSGSPFADFDISFTDSDIIEFDDNSGTSSNSPIKKSSSYLNMFSSLFSNHESRTKIKSKCKCAKPIICERCIQSKYCKYSSIKIRRKAFSFIYQYDVDCDGNMYKQYCILSDKLNQGIQINAKRWTDLYFNIFDDANKQNYYSCQRTKIPKNIWESNTMTIGNNKDAEEFINYKLWEYYKKSRITLGTIQELGVKIINKKFTCELGDECPQLTLFKHDINDYVFNKISYSDYKLVLHVNIYHPIIV